MFKKHVTGKAARAWRQKRDTLGEAALKEGLAPKAKIRPTETNKKLFLFKKPKAQAKVKAAAIEDGQAEDGDECKKADEDDSDEKDNAAAHRRASRDSRCATRGEVHEHHLFKKQVLGECSNEGRFGEVTAVHRVWVTETEPERIECTVFSTCGALSERAENTQEIKAGVFIEPTSLKIDCSQEAVH